MLFVLIDTDMIFVLYCRSSPTGVIVSDWYCWRGVVGVNHASFVFDIFSELNDLEIRLKNKKNNRFVNALAASA